MAKKKALPEIEVRVPKDWTGPTVRVKDVLYPDHTEDQDEADARRKAWEKDHAPA